MKKILSLVTLAIISLIGISMNNHSVCQTQEDYVPDKKTAANIAEAIWLPIYGKSVLKEKPYKTMLVGDSIWVVTGSPTRLKPNEDFVGGTAYIEIRRSDCKILKCYHEK